MTHREITTIRRLVGEVTEWHLRFVDCYVGSTIGVFVPVAGPCYYSVTPDHSHPGYSFILTFDTYARVAVKDGLLRSQPGQVLAIVPEAIHHEVIEDEFPRYIAIFIERNFFEEHLKIYSSLAVNSLDFRVFAAGKELIGLLREFMDEYEARLPGFERLLDAVGLRITHSLLRAVHGISAEPTRIGSRVEIHRAIEYLQTHAGENVSVAKLAEVAAMSQSHFNRVFRLETGVSPHAYLVRVRLERGKMLLRSGEHSITEIAFLCGFTSSSHFSNSFRGHYNLTPTEYARLLGDDGISTKHDGITIAGTMR